MYSVISRSITIFFICIFIDPVLFCQDHPADFVLKGLLLNTGTKKPVAFCNIFNESKHTVNISDTNGWFNIRVSAGDTLIFTALGYLGKVFIAQPRHQDTFVKILLDVRVYEIDELEFSMPRTYPGFKKAFLEVDPEKDIPMSELPKYNPYIRPKLLDTNYIYSRNFKIFHPVSGFYYKHNQTEQSKRKLRYLQEQQLHQHEVDEKYNKGMLSRITGFTGDTLINFMLYCNFSFNFLYTATELEIVEEIDHKKLLFIKYCYGQCIPVTNPKKYKKQMKRP